MLKVPEVYKDPQQPIEHVPYFTNSGEFRYWPRLDTSRVMPDSFTYMIGTVFVNKLNTKLQLRLSVDESRELIPSLSNITTYAAKEQSRAFSRQLRKVYGTGRPKLVAEYQFHKSFILEKLEINNLTIDDVDVQHGIPIASINKKNPLAKASMAASFVSIVTVPDVGVMVVVTIGKFQNAYGLSEYNNPNATVNKLKELEKKGKTYPSYEFVDDFAEAYLEEEDIDESDF